MELVELKLTVSASAPGTTLSVVFDGQTIWQNDPASTPSKISHKFTDDGEHTLTLELLGKTQNHTRVNSNKEIVEDLLVSIKDFTIDDVGIDQQVWKLAEYRHDFNGTAAPITEKFYGVMGCNGTVTMKFTSPAYLWLLEKL